MPRPVSHLQALRDGLVVSSAYDALNRRLLKMKGAGGTEYYVYAGSQVILDVDSTGAVLWEYAWYPGAVDRLFAVRTPSDTFAAILDPQTGSVRGLARFRTGGRVKEYAERPWGDVVADTGLVLRYRFAGREFDQESGLSYMRARYYDPAVGRWIREDPMPPRPPPTRPATGTFVSPSSENSLRQVETEAAASGVSRCPAVGGPWHAP